MLLIWMLLCGLSIHMTPVAASTAIGLRLTPRPDDGASFTDTDAASGAFATSDGLTTKGDEASDPEPAGIQPRENPGAPPANGHDAGDTPPSLDDMPAADRLTQDTGVPLPGSSAAAEADLSETAIAPLPPLPSMMAVDLMRSPAISSADEGAKTPPVPMPDPDAPITLALNQVDLVVALKAFAEFTGLNIVTGDHVRGTVTLSLNQVPWRRAFETLLDGYGLAMQQHGNVLWIAPASEIALREKQGFEAQARIAQLKPLVSRMFVLQYQRAEDIRKLLAGSGNRRVLSQRGTAMADPRTDHLFVTDLPERLAEVAALIKSIDQPARQVLIESRIVEADESFARNLGVRLALLDGRPAGQGGPAPGLQAGLNGNLYDLAAVGIKGYSAAALGTTLFNAGDSRKLMLELSALEAQGHGRIVSSPRVVTADRVRALIEQGTELPYQAKVDTSLSAVQFRRAGLKLEVIPHITPDHHVMLDVDVTKDSVGAETTAGPAIDTKHVQTQVRVDNGGTVAIGGIYIQDERRDTSGVPWLGRLPLIGFLFRQSTVAKSKSELMIFITPTEVSPDAGPDANLAETQAALPQRPQARLQASVSDAAAGGAPNSQAEPDSAPEKP